MNKEAIEAAAQSYYAAHGKPEIEFFMHCNSSDEAEWAAYALLAIDDGMPIVDVLAQLAEYAPAAVVAEAQTHALLFHAFSEGKSKPGIGNHETLLGYQTEYAGRLHTTLNRPVIKGTLGFIPFVRCDNKAGRAVLVTAPETATVA